MSDEDDIIKVCEVTLLDDKAEFEELLKNGKSEILPKLEDMKIKSLRLIEMYAALAKTQAKILMTQAIKINQIFSYNRNDGLKGDAVALLYMIASILKFPNKDERQHLL